MPDQQFCDEKLLLKHLCKLVEVSSCKILCVYNLEERALYDFNHGCDVCERKNVETKVKVWYKISERAVGYSIDGYRL